MKVSRKQAIIACTLIAGMLSAPAFGQSYGLIARGDCPKTAPRAGHAPARAPAASYKPVTELERYVAELQNEPQQPRGTVAKRTRSMPSRF